MRPTTLAMILVGLGLCVVALASAAGAMTPATPQEQDAAAGRSETVYVGSISLFPTMVQLPSGYMPRSMSKLRVLKRV